MIIIRAATPKNEILKTVGALLMCLLIGALAKAVAKYFGAPMEMRLAGLCGVMTGIAMAIWHVGALSDGRRPTKL